MPCPHKKATWMECEECRRTSNYGFSFKGGSPTKNIQEWDKRADAGKRPAISEDPLVLGEDGVCR